MKPLITLFILALATGSPSQVTLKPGDDIQAAVDAHAEGSVFTLQPGVYRGQSFTPRNGQQFIGQDGAVLNGAVVLEGWKPDGGRWVTDMLPPASRRSHGSCKEEGDLCKLREDLFIDDQLYARVGSLAEVEPGTWYRDGNRAYIADNPTGKLAELSARSVAVTGGRTTGVLLKNLVFEKYASKAQDGAIMGDGTKDWKVFDVTARYNHGSGLRVGAGMHIKGGRYVSNGQLGIGGGDGDGVLIEDVEVAYNNYARFNWHWEAGGIKFVLSDGFTVRNSDIHHNIGPGIWPDIRNTNAVIEGNHIHDNWGMGIQYEISYGGVIHNNLVAENARDGWDVWRWGSNILIQNSRGVEVQGNIVVVSADKGHGINLLQADRGDNEKPGLPPLITVNNRVHDNTIVHLGTRGQNGAVADWAPDKMRNGNNVFDGNSYIVPTDTFEYWEWLGQQLAWPSVRSVIEQNGSLTVAPDPGVVARRLSDTHNGRLR